MTTLPLPPVETQAVGFAPILKFFFEEAGVQTIIDQHVPLDPRRKILTHGQASVAMVTAILCQVFQMYRLCQFAEKSQILNIIFPNIASKEYFDDRLADTLDAIYDYGIGNLEMLITFKNKRRGRASKNGDEKVAVTTNYFSVKLIFHQEHFNKALGRCGYYPLITNKNDLSILEILTGHAFPNSCSMASRTSSDIL